MQPLRIDATPEPPQNHYSGLDRTLSPLLLAQNCPVLLAPRHHKTARRLQRSHPDTTTGTGFIQQPQSHSTACRRNPAFRPSSFFILHSSFFIPLGPPPNRTPRPANTVAPLDQRLSCNDVASMFLGCSLLVSSFLVPLFVPYCPRSRHPQHAKTRALQLSLPPSARAPRSSRPASRQPTIAAANIETAAAWSRLQ
jgi:hypothetical protein